MATAAEQAATAMAAARPPEPKASESGKKIAKADNELQTEISSEADRHIQRLKEMRRQEAAKKEMAEKRAKAIQENQKIQAELQRLTKINDEKYPHVDQSDVRDIAQRSYPRPPFRTPLGTNQPHHPQIRFMTEYLRPHIVFVIMPFLQDWERQNWLHAAMLGPLFVPNSPPPGHPDFGKRPQTMHPANWGMSIKQQEIQKQKHREQLIANGATLNAQGQVMVNLNPKEQQIFNRLQQPQQRQRYLQQVNQQRMRMRQNEKFAQEVVKQGEMPRRGQVLRMLPVDEKKDAQEEPKEDAVAAADANANSEPQTVAEHMRLMALAEKEKEKTGEASAEAKPEAEAAVEAPTADDKKDSEADPAAATPEAEAETKVEDSKDADATVATTTADAGAEAETKVEECKDPDATDATAGADNDAATKAGVANPDVLPNYATTDPTKMSRPVSTKMLDTKTGKPAEQQGQVVPPANLVFPARPRIQLNSQLGIVDPHTLLERLNSRRLYKRANAKDFPNLTYDKNKSTSTLANDEWERVLVCSRESKPFPNPPKYELMLFSPINQPVAILASYPRSGNSLMRTLYERTTVRVTGSDMRGGLAKHDLVGEAAVGNGMVQFVKTHFPERRGVPPFKASSVILLVRNPYDAIDSYFNLMMTRTHTTSVSEEVRAKNRAAFEEMAMKEIQVWRDFHEYWLAQEIPTLLVRYEDLTRHTDRVMARVLEHALDVDHMHFFCRRIEHCFAAETIEKLGSYKPRSGGIGKALKKYSPELLQKLNVGIVDTMQKLGYGSFLVPNTEDWDLTPLPGYATKLARPRGTVIVNQGDLVRTNELNTNWGQIRRQMGVTDGNPGPCQCWKCKQKEMN